MKCIFFYPLNFCFQLCTSLFRRCNYLLIFLLLLVYGSTMAQPVYTWAAGMGNTGDDQPGEMTIDNAGNVYTTGVFQGTVDFDPGPGTFNLSATGGYDVFLQKLDADGNFVWLYGSATAMLMARMELRWMQRATSILPVISGVQ